MSLPPRPDGTVPGKDDAAGIANIGNKMKSLFGFRSKGKPATGKEQRGAGSRPSPRSEPKVARQPGQGGQSNSPGRRDRDRPHQQQQQQHQPPQQSHPATRADAPTTTSDQPKWKTNRAARTADPASPSAQRGATPPKPAAGSDPTSAGTAPDDTAPAAGQAADTADPEGDAPREAHPPDSAEVDDDDDGAGGTADGGRSGDGDDEDGLGLDGTVSSKSRAIIETAKQEIEAATDAWRDLDAQQAELLMTVNAQLLESVSNRRLLTDKQAGLDAAIADEDYDLAAAIEDQMADLKLSLQVEASADRVELRAALLGLLTAKQDVWGKESEIHAQTVELLQDSMHAQEEEVRAPSSLRPMLCRVLACPIWSAGVQRTGCGTIVPLRRAALH
jgi:hypothetical protein